jgi:hypothetical protein
MHFKIKWNRSVLMGLVIAMLQISPLFTLNVSSEVKTAVTLSSGIRVDSLDWNIAGDINGNNPNILSELTWDDLLIVLTKADGKLVVADRFYVRGYVDYGWIIDGENQDSDYAGDDRTREFSRSNNDTDEGNVLDASIGAGYQFGPVWKLVMITPLAGYSYHEQNLVITNGYQTIPRRGPFAGLDSTYDTEWKGPWAGVDFSVLFSERLTLTNSFEFHWVDYDAVANWNLRSDFQHPKSFEHTTDGYGILLAADLDFSIAAHLALTANINYQGFSTDDGTSRTFFASGRTRETRLNEVNWDSVAGMIGLSFLF